MLETNAPLITSKTYELTLGYSYLTLPNLVDTSFKRRFNVDRTFWRCFNALIEHSKVTITLFERWKDVVWITTIRSRLQNIKEYKRSREEARIFYDGNLNTKMSPKLVMFTALKGLLTWIIIKVSFFRTSKNLLVDTQLCHVTNCAEDSQEKQKQRIS